jgi:hypothetical protein
MRRDLLGNVERIVPRIYGFLTRGRQRIGLRIIQGEINSFRVKGIDIDDVFSVLVKMMKKLELRASLADMDSN